MNTRDPELRDELTEASIAESGAERAMDAQSVAELSQELTLVARALFAQLLPSTAARAVAGVEEFLSGAPATPDGAGQPAAHVSLAPAAGPAPTVPSPPVSVPTPAVAPATPQRAESPHPVAVPLPVPDATPATEIPAAAAVTPPQPASAPAPIPVPALGTETTIDTEPSTTPRKRGPRSLTMLEEIGFLDE